MAANSDNQLASGYDGNGNPPTARGQTATFDAENRLTNGGVYGWGSNGLRAFKGSRSTYFLYDGSLPVCELSSTGALQAVNTFGAAGLLSRRKSSVTTYYTFDAQGNVAQRMDASRNVISSDLYDSFGSGVTTGSADVFGYGGREGYYSDSETGLILCGHRFYDPGIGRFLNRDPIGYAGGLNDYAYTGNNPTNWGDPSGFAPCPDPSNPQGTGDPAAGSAESGTPLEGQNPDANNPTNFPTTLAMPPGMPTPEGSADTGANSSEPTSNGNQWNPKGYGPAMAIPRIMAV